MRNNFHIMVPWLSPSQYVSGRVNVAAQHQATRAAMNTNRQRLWHDTVTVAAFLCCALWINTYHLSAGPFCLVGEDTEKLAPASVGDTTSQPMVPDKSLDVQAFHGDDPISVYQSAGDLVVHVLSCISDFRVQGRDTLLDCLSSTAATVTAGQRPLAPSQFLQAVFKDSAVAELFAVRGSHKRLQAHINTHRSDAARRLWFRHFNGETDEPLPVFTDYSCRPDLGLVGNVAMPVYANSSDTLESQLSVNDLAAATVSHHVEGERVEPICRFEARIARPLAAFNSGVERLKRLVQFPQRPLGRGNVETGVVRVVSALNREPHRLLVVGPVHASRFPAQLFTVECGVVKSAVSLKRRCQFPLLVGIGEQAILVGVDHLLRLLLEEVIDSPTDQFRDCQASLLGQFSQGSDLEFRQMEVYSLHTAGIHTNHTTVKGGNSTVA